MKNIEEKPVLIGHSLGGAVVQKILYQFPEKIQAVVLIAPLPPDGILRTFLRLTFTSFIKFNKFLLYNFISNINFPAEIFLSKELPAEKKDVYKKLLQPESIKALMDTFRRIVPKSVNAKVPILILGSKKDWFFPEKTIIKVGKFYKVKPIIFPNICHDMMLDPQWRK